MTLILKVRWRSLLNLYEQMAKSKSPVKPKAAAAKSPEEPGAAIAGNILKSGATNWPRRGGQRSTMSVTLGRASRVCLWNKQIANVKGGRETSAESTGVARMGSAVAPPQGDSI